MAEDLVTGFQVLSMQESGPEIDCNWCTDRVAAASKHIYSFEASDVCSVHRSRSFWTWTHDQADTFAFRAAASWRMRIFGASGFEVILVERAYLPCTLKRQDEGSVLSVPYSNIPLMPRRFPCHALSTLCSRCKN